MSPSTGRIPSNARRSNARRSTVQRTTLAGQCGKGRLRVLSRFRKRAACRRSRVFGARPNRSGPRTGHDVREGAPCDAKRPVSAKPKDVSAGRGTHCLKRQPKTSHGGGWRTQLPSAGCKRMPARVPDAESGRMKNGTRERVPNRTYARGALESQSERELGPGRVLHHISRLGRVDVSAAARCRADGNVAAVPKHVARLGGRNGAGPRR